MIVYNIQFSRFHDSKDLASNYHNITFDRLLASFKPFIIMRLFRIIIFLYGQKIIEQPFWLLIQTQHF